MSHESEHVLRHFHHRDFCVEDLARRNERVCVLLPAREEAATIGAIVDVLAGLQARNAIDEILVIDAASADGTAEIAAARGARVLQRSTLLADFGPALGKGDAVWRGLSATDADIVCVLDADLVDFDERFVVGLVGPLLRNPVLELIKGAFDRPYRDSKGQITPAEGGRVTELMARPLLRLWYPELSTFAQPLSGQWAGRRDFIARRSFWTGYALEICLLLESFEAGGMALLGESYLGTLDNRHQSLTALSAMAYEVLLGVTQHRARRAGIPIELRRDDSGILVRPPLIGLARRSTSR